MVGDGVVEGDVGWGNNFINNVWCLLGWERFQRGLGR